MRPLTRALLVNLLIVATAHAAGEKDGRQRQKQKGPDKTAPGAAGAAATAHEFRAKPRLVMKTTKPTAKLTPGGKLSRYSPLGYGKDESPDVAEHQQPDYKAWRESAIHDLELDSGEHVPVALVEVGPPDAEKPTIVHFHGATVQLENVLLWRLARAFEAEGRPVRIVAPRFNDAEKVVQQLAKDGKKVATMGHSAGNGPAQRLAGRYPELVSHYIGIAGGGGGAGGVKSLMFQGTNDGGSLQMFSYGAKNADVIGLALEGVDHSMRFAPGGLPGGPMKGKFNATPETAQVARRLAGTVMEFVTGNPGDKPFLAGLRGGAWQGSFLEGR
jgi:pimeloyl-ACP methyl ester carboxylesterase